jgi:hypothetical protein
MLRHPARWPSRFFLLVSFTHCVHATDHGRAGRGPKAAFTPPKPLERLLSHESAQNFDRSLNLSGWRINGNCEQHILRCPRIDSLGCFVTWVQAEFTLLSRSRGPQHDQLGSCRAQGAAGEHLKPVLLTAYRLGLRLGEILSLTWDRVDRERGLITLRAIDTKTKQPRRVPMTADLLATFRQLYKVRYLGQDRVFLREGKLMTDIRTAFENAKERAGITDFRFHDLRHCAATAFRRAGVDNTTAMSIIGHKSEKMWRRYNTIDETDLKAAAAKLNTVITLAQEQRTASAANTAIS